MSASVRGGHRTCDVVGDLGDYVSEGVQAAAGYALHSFQTRSGCWAMWIRTLESYADECRRKFGMRGLGKERPWFVEKWQQMHNTTPLNITPRTVLHVTGDGQFSGAGGARLRGERT
jgi:hypothetical protein